MESIHSRMLGLVWIHRPRCMYGKDTPQLSQVSSNRRTLKVTFELLNSFKWALFRWSSLMLGWPSMDWQKEMRLGKKKTNKKKTSS